MSSTRLISAVAMITAVVTAAALAPAPVSADPGHSDAVSRSARIVVTKQVNPNRFDLLVDSPAMGKRMPVTVLTPGGEQARPAFYMLDGAEAGEKESDWLTKTNVEKYFKGRNVNVVLPAGGAGSFYTNWQQKDRRIGKPQWETFLTKELPPLIDSAYVGSGRNGVMGLSMGGQSAFALGARNPNLYQAIGSLSGCPVVTGPANDAYVRSTVARMGGNADNMWGKAGSKEWREHDPSFRLDALRGKRMFISSGSGAAGPPDIATKDEDGVPKDVQIAVASTLEAGANRCSLEFAAKLTAARIPFESAFRIFGTHRWEYWEADMPKAWEALSPALW